MANGTLRLDEEFPLNLNLESGVASKERLPLLAGAPPSEVPSLPTGERVEFADLLGDASTGQIPRSVGPGVGEISPADLEASGDVRGVVAEQRPKMDSIRWALDLTNNLLGKPSGSQEAAILNDPKDMSRFQKISLWTADLIALSEGRVRPSDQLDLQRFNAFSLDELRSQQKAASGFILKLEVPAKAKRTGSVAGRKCRASYVKTIEIQEAHGTQALKGTVAQSIHGVGAKYRKGRITKPDSYNDDPLVECTHGIHFFLTREEAMEWL